MNKQKRKTQPVNTRKYWIGFSILLVFLLIPLRFTTYMGRGQEDVFASSWERSFTVMMYGSFTAIIVLLMLIFTLRGKFRPYNALKLLLIVCLCLSIVRTSSNIEGHRWHCLMPGYVPTYSIGAEEWDSVIFEPIWCSGHVLGACCYTEYIKIKHIPIVINSRWVNMWSPNAGLQQDW